MKKNELDFHEATHRYFLNGKEVLSVTKVFEITAITDFSKVKFEILEAAKIVGDLVHQLAHLYGQGTLDEESVDPALYGYYEAIRSYYDEQVKKILYLEQKIFDAYLGYAGTLDIIYINRSGKICLDDYKTPTVLHPATALQTAAYKSAAAKNLRVKIQERGGVRLDKSGKYERKVYRDPSDFPNFRAALQVANWLKKNKLRA